MRNLDTGEIETGLDMNRFLKEANGAPALAAGSYIELEGSDGHPLRIYDRSIVSFFVDGPPTLVVGTAVCVLGLVDGAVVSVRGTAEVVAEQLGMNLSGMLRFTSGAGDVVYVAAKVRAVAGGPRGTTLCLAEFGVLVVRELVVDVLAALDAR